MALFIRDILLSNCVSRRLTRSFSCPVRFSVRNLFNESRKPAALSKIRSLRSGVGCWMCIPNKALTSAAFASSSVACWFLVTLSVLVKSMFPRRLSMTMRSIRAKATSKSAMVCAWRSVSLTISRPLSLYLSNSALTSRPISRSSGVSATFMYSSWNFLNSRSSSSTRSRASLSPDSA